ncbi:protein kinase, putative [Leishmania tarentolae]|uniref:Protein kinase, putative n=1 Tax=Leishmania tarentolae TaxID=5689 RepID=A0A640KII3_LEITA|nr:protein kinase, putative [Leishmania tarentolae]
MGCSTSTHASVGADKDALPKSSLYSSSQATDQVISARKNRKEDRTNGACTEVSEDPSRAQSSDGTEGRRHSKSIRVMHHPKQLGRRTSNGDMGKVRAFTSPTDKSTCTRFSFPQRSLLSVDSKSEAVDSEEKKPSYMTASPSPFTGLQRRLSDGGHGHSSFTMTSTTLLDANETAHQLTQTRAAPTDATAPTTLLSTPSGVIEQPLQKQHQIESSNVKEEGFSTEWDGEEDTPRGGGIPASTAVERGNYSVTHGMMAPSAGFGVGVDGTRDLRSKSPKWIDLSRKRSQSTVSLLSLADTPNNNHALSSGSDLGRDILGESPVFGGLTTGDGRSQPQSGYNTGRATHAERFDQQRHNNGLAVFCNQSRECALCRNATVAFACEVCDDFFLCEDCRFDLEAMRTIHDPTHAMLSLQDNHYNASRTFGGDSIFSLSGDGGASSLFYRPCFQCKRVIDDVEPVYRCDQCDYIVCQECFIQREESVDAVQQASSLSEAMAIMREEHLGYKPLPIGLTALGLASSQAPPHDHELKRFQRKSRFNSVPEGAVITKTRNSGGNKVINDYVVVRQIGHGSYAKVKLVQHVHTQELFALKILRRQKKAALSGINLGRSRVKGAMAGISEDDLLREIAVMKFIDHPNVIKLKEVIEDVDSQKVYIIMEYCEKGPVHVAGDPALPLEQVRQYGADILRGLLHLHSEFLYHRDIKPANCLVNRDGVVKIADFGTCNSQIRTKLAEGTPAFSCPEQVRGEEVSAEVVDSWAFALTVYEMACGTLPVSTNSFMQHRSLLMGKGPVPIPNINDEQLRDLLEKMLEKDLSKRLLLPAAAQHPFFVGCHIDVHGTVPGAGPRYITVPATSSGSAAAQQQESQTSSLAELYDKALESVHRGKNLKDCFHGVRGLRRVRRKELETARHSATDDQIGGGEADAEDNPHVMNRYNLYGGSDGSGSDVENEEEAAAVVDEAVEHHLLSQDPKLELTHVALTTPATLEKLNKLCHVTAEVKLSHNALVRLPPLSLSTFATLMDISITFNRLEAFPQEVLAAPRLVRLDLSHNRIDSIPDTLVTKAMFLERLNLHHNHITSVGTTTITVVEPPPATRSTPTPATATFRGSNRVVVPDASVVSSSVKQPGLSGHHGSSRSEMVSVLAAPCLRHVRLSGNPLERLPDALETTHKLQLVLDAIPDLMEQWDAHMQADNQTRTSTAGQTTGGKCRLPAVIVWDDSFPVRIPNVEPAVWLAVNSMAIYRVQTLRLCKTRRVVLCQCADPRFPNGLFLSEELAVYFAALSKALQDCREQQQQQQLAAEALSSSGAQEKAIPSEALPPIVGKAARRYVESYFFVTDDENEEEGGYHSLVSYLYDSLSANIPVLVVVVSSDTPCAVRTNIVAAISTCLTRLRGGDPEQLDAEQAELIISTMRSLYA